MPYIIAKVGIGIVDNPVNLCFLLFFTIRHLLDKELIFYSSLFLNLSPSKLDFYHI